MAALLRTGLQPDRYDAEPEDEQKFADDRAGQGRLDDFGQPGLEREERDDQLGDIAERRVQDAAELRACDRSKPLRGEADDPGQAEDRRCRKNKDERLIRASREHLEDDRRETQQEGRDDRDPDRGRHRLEDRDGSERPPRMAHWALTIDRWGRSTGVGAGCRSRPRPGAQRRRVIFRPPRAAPPPPRRRPDPRPTWRPMPTKQAGLPRRSRTRPGASARRSVPARRARRAGPGGSPRGASSAPGRSHRDDPGHTTPRGRRAWPPPAPGPRRSPCPDRRQRSGRAARAAPAHPPAGTPRTPSAAPRPRTRPQPPGPPMRPG